VHARAHGDGGDVSGEGQEVDLQLFEQIGAAERLFAAVPD
jgi:hypothetical protein